MPRLITKAYDPNRGAPPADCVTINPSKIYVHCTTVEEKLAAMVKLGELSGLAPSSMILATLRAGGATAADSIRSYPYIYAAPSDHCVGATGTLDRFGGERGIPAATFLETTYATTKD